MKSVIKNAIPYLIIVALVIGLKSVWRKAASYKEVAQILETTVSDLNQEVKQTRIQLNDSIEVYQAEVRNLTFTQANLKAKYDKLLSASKSSPKDVNSVTEIGFVVHDRDTVVAMVDSFGGLNARLVDPFVNIEVEVHPDRNTIIEYNVKDSLTVLNIQKKHRWLFGLIKWNEHKSTKVINHNPKAIIQSLQTIDILE